MPELFITHQDGQVTLSLLGNQARAPFLDPFDASQAASLGWLLEDCPAVPFGPERQQYEDTVAAARALGVGLYSSLTPTPVTAAIMETFAALPAETTQVRLSSDHVAFLSLPWELLRAPGNGPDLFSPPREMSRTLLNFAAPRSTTRVATQMSAPIKVLLVSPRPYGAQDVRPRTIRGPLLRIAAEFAEAIQLQVLRPATLTALASKLRSSEHVTIVHFDGHGYYEPNEASGGKQTGLVFEKADGSPDYVSASEFAETIELGNPTVVVLNACRSAFHAKVDSVQTVAARLVPLVPNVVAMTHNVRAPVAAQFISTFYRSLAAGGTVDSATTAGRRVLHDDPDTSELIRPYHIIPVLYRQGENTDLVVATARPAVEPARVGTDVRDLDSLMYRDDLVAKLDRDLAEPTPIVLSGPVGGGKTRFLRAFSLYASLTRDFDRVHLITGDAVNESPEQFRAAVRPEAESEVRVLHVWDGMDKLLPACEELLAEVPVTHRVIISLRFDTLQTPHRGHQLVDVPNEVVSHALSESIRDTGKTETVLANFAQLHWLMHCIGWHGATLDGVIHALRQSSLQEICWSLTCGVPDETDDPLANQRVMECLAELPEADLPKVALLGLGGTVTWTNLMAILTHRGLIDDPFEPIIGTTIDRQEWNRLFKELERAGLAVCDRSPGNVTPAWIPTVVRYALRAILAQFLSPQNLQALAVGFGRAVAGILEYGLTFDEDVSPYDLLRTRNAMVNTMESATMVAICSALKAHEFALAERVAHWFAMEPAGSFGWERAGYFLRLLTDVHRESFGDIPDASAFFYPVDMRLANHAMVSDDWRAAQMYVEHLLSDPAAEFVKANLVILHCWQSKISLELGDHEGAVQALAAGVAAAKGAASEALLPCRKALRDLTVGLALSRHQAAGLAAEVGLNINDTPDPAAIEWDTKSTEELVVELRRADLSGDHESSVNLRRYIGRRFRRTGDLDAARQWLTAALRVEQHAGALGRLSRAETAHELAMLEEAAERLGDAAAWCRYVIEEAKENPRLCADAYHELGIIELLNNRPSEALDGFEAARIRYQTLGMRSFAADSLLHKAYAYWGLGDRTNAVDVATEAVSQLEAMQSWQQLGPAHHFLAVVAEAEGETTAQARHQAAAKEAFARISPDEMLDIGTIPAP